MHGTESKYLLTGLARCGQCDETMTVRSREHGRQRAYFYACSSFHHRGKAACANSLEMRLKDADDEVLTVLEEQLLDPSVIAEAMARAIAVATDGPQDAATRRQSLSRGLDEVSGQLERLTAAVLAGGEAATIVHAMRERERRREVLSRELRDLDRPREAKADAGRFRQQLVDRMAEWRSVLRAHPVKARQMLRKLIRDRIVFTADRAPVFPR